MASTLWIQGVKKEDKEQFLLTLNNTLTGNPIISKLREIVQLKLNELDSYERTEDYADTAWAFKQAHNNGARQMLQMVDNLLAT